MKTIRLDELLILAAHEDAEFFQKLKNIVEKCAVVEERKASLIQIVDPTTLYTRYYCGACRSNIARNLFSSKYCLHCGARFIKNDETEDMRDS